MAGQRALFEFLILSLPKVEEEKAMTFFYRDVIAKDGIYYLFLKFATLIPMINISWNLGLP